MSIHQNHLTPEQKAKIVLEVLALIHLDFDYLTVVNSSIATFPLTKVIGQIPVNPSQPGQAYLKTVLLVCHVC
jgi:hypothetical protein